MREAVDEAEAVIAVAETMPEGSTERSEAFGLADELTQVAEEAAAVVLDEGEQPALVVRDGDEVQLLPTEFIRVGTEHASADVPGAVSDDDLAAFLEPAVPVAPLPPQTGPHVLPPTAHAPVPASAHVWDDGQPAPVQAQAPAVPDQPQQLAPITASDEDWLTAPVTAEGKTEKGEDPIGEMFPWS